MNCPVDQVGMRRLEDKGIALDWCDLCDGIWLDAGELSRLANTASDLPGLPPTPKSSSSPSKSNKRPSCPRCLQSMEEVPYGEEASLLVDQCLRCHGIWLEWGELQAIYDTVGKKRMTSSDPTVQADPLAMTVLGVVLSITVGLLLVLLALFFLNRR